MVKSSPHLDLVPSKKPAMTVRTRVPVTVESVDENGSLEVRVHGSDLPAVVTSGEPGLWAVGAEAVGLMDAGGRIVRVLAPGTLPEGATPVAVGTAALKLQEHEDRLAGIRGEWQSDVDTAKELAESTSAQALDTARAELRESKSALENKITAAKNQANAAAGKAEALRSDVAALTSAQGGLSASVADAAQKAQDAWNRAVAVAAASPNLLTDWPASWTVGAEFIKSETEIVHAKQGTGSSPNRIYSQSLKISEGTYRFTIEVSNTGEAAEVTLGAYYSLNGSYVRSLWPNENKKPVAAGSHRRSYSVDLTIAYDSTVDAIHVICYVNGGSAGGVTIHGASLIDVSGLHAMQQSLLSETAAAEARAKAAAVTLVQEAANGKNSITRSTSAPGSTPGKAVGDTWKKFAGVDAQGTPTGPVIGRWGWTGSQWVPELIGNAVIDYVTVEKIKAGAADFDVTVIRRLTGNKAFLEQIYSNSVTVIPAHNLLYDTWGESGQGLGIEGVGTSWDTTTTAPDGLPTTKIEGIWGPKGANVFAHVEPGEEYVFEAWVKASKADSRLFVEMRDESGKHCVDVYPITTGESHALNGANQSHYLIGGAAVPTSWVKMQARVVPRANVTSVKIGMIYPNHSSGTVRDAVTWIRCRMFKPAGAVDIKDGAITASKITVTKELWGKFANFVKINTQMLVAGGAKITDGLLADKINLTTEIIAGNENGTHAKLDSTGLHISRRTTSNEVVEVVRLGVDGSDDYLGITDPDGNLVSSMDAAGGAAFASLNVSGAASMSGLMLDGLDVGEALANQAKAVSYVTSGLTQPAFNGSLHGAGQQIMVDEHRVSNPYDEPLMCLYVGSSLNARVETLPNGVETFGAIELNLRYLDRPLGTFNQPNASAPTLSTQFLTNQGVGYTSGPVVVPFIVPPQTSRTLVTFVKGHNTRFSIPKGQFTSTVITLGMSMPEGQMPGRMVAWATDTGYQGFTPLPPVTRYTKEYRPTWGASYHVNSGTRYGPYDSQGEVVHGNVPGAGAYVKGCIGFPDMMGDLSGATIQKVEVYLYFTHWWYGAGGTAGVGYHNALNTPPTVSGGIRQTEITTGKPGGRWISMPPHTWGALKSGAFRGLLLMPSSTDVGQYGRCRWRDARIRVTYTK